MVERLQIGSGLLGRRVFLRSCVLLGAGAWAFGALPAVAGQPAKAKGAYVVINGWVLPSAYLRDRQA